MELNRIIEDMIAEVNAKEGIALDEIPNIDLYMDQLTTFMEERLRQGARNPEADKILTKTMINNYAKNDLLPPPVRKKYSRDHILLLIFIYYLKSILSISDIDVLTKPLREHFHTGDRDPKNIAFVYETIRELIVKDKGSISDDLRRKEAIVQEAFTGLEEADADEMRTFSFLIMTAFDIYVKKLMLEKTIDRLARTADEKPVRADKHPKKEKHKGKKH